LFKYFGDKKVSFKTILTVVVSPAELSLDEAVPQGKEVVLCLGILLFDSLVELVLLDELGAWFDVGGCGLLSQVEEVDVGLHETFREKLDSDVLWADFLCKLEVTFVLEILATACHLGRATSLFASNLLSVLLKHSRLGCGD